MTIAMTQTVLLYTTFPSQEVALKIAHMLIAQRLAACANLLPSITSVYAWQNSIEQTNEVAMLVKTTMSQVDAAQRAIVSAHPYDCPCVLQLPIAGGHPDFLSWITTQTQQADPTTDQY